MFIGAELCWNMFLSSAGTEVRPTELRTALFVSLGLGSNPFSCNAFLTAASLPLNPCVLRDRTCNNITKFRLNPIENLCTSRAGHQAWSTKCISNQSFLKTLPLNHSGICTLLHQEPRFQNDLEQEGAAGLIHAVCCRFQSLNYSGTLYAFEKHLQQKYTHGFWIYIHIRIHIHTCTHTHVRTRTHARTFVNSTNLSYKHNTNTDTHHAL